MGLKGSEETNICPYLEPQKSSKYPTPSHSTYLGSILILSYHLRFNIPMRDLGLCVQKMETADTSETFVRIYQTTPRNIPENSALHIYWRKDLKFLLKIVYLVLFERLTVHFYSMVLFWKRGSNFISNLLTYLLTPWLHSPCRALASRMGSITFTCFTK
jgi:hypothetical protein